ncbi:MAG TPA: isoleucine--tRNA ligase [Saprospirales bacterium]|nr:isoleucine--tRNA ligase [Saprospirales bacterium]HAY71290.1 isoleucine--tRNA ligase [Saprospirales bacterium]HRQ30435.1 isoleucine--tRNA ligase [Saprospiraceae bacterium]
MTKYREFKGLDFNQIDEEVLIFWEEGDVFHRSVNQRSEENPFIFYEGPPSANGLPGIHHVLGRAIKDLVCRYQTMKGKRVERKGGWDTHGLPVELKVESELGITKDDIGEKISVEEYNRHCRTTVMQYKDKWDDITRKMGFWVDLDKPYMTFDNSYIETVWYLLKELYNKDLLYKGYTIQPYSPSAGTGLSSHELNLPGCYRDVSDTSMVAQFKVIQNEQSAFLFEDLDDGDVYFLAWTTTPWTLPSNTALAVGKNIDYIRIKTYNPYTFKRVNLILAETLLPSWFKEDQAQADFHAYQENDKLIPYALTGKYKGRDLEGIRYEQLMPYAQPEDGDAFRVITGDFVSTEDGTGIVHIAPSFGADDMFVGKQNGIGSLTLVDKQGKFTENAGDLAGKYVKNYKDDPNWEDIDVLIAVKLKYENKAFNVKKYVHSYPHCWRTDKPILYYPLDSWFIRTTGMKDRMIELNNTIHWYPEHTGSGRFGKWLENLQDWNLSRSRFWGIPLPIWRTEDAAEELIIGSVQELSDAIEASVKAGFMENNPYKTDAALQGIDLHKPYIDRVVLVSPNGKKMFREPDLIDVWFDSGAMPAAQHHYPFNNQEKFNLHFPADFISEGVDQTRGWFFTLHAIATMVFDSVAFKNVISTGLVLDKTGEKMSKRKGNVVDPFETIDHYGADPTRWYMIANAPPWDNLKFDLKGVEETTRKFFMTLYNTYSFFALYANLDEFRYDRDPVPVDRRPEIDRWIISLLNTLVKETDEDLQNYDLTSALRKIQTFVYDHLSNWYVRLNRRRFWKGDLSEDKLSAYQTLYESLITLSKLMAPGAPFMSEWMYRNLNEVSKREHSDSVHLVDYPKADESLIDKALEERMEYAQRISSLVLSLRKKQMIRVRQPLNKIMLPILDRTFEDQVEKVKDLILQEVNIKEIEYISDTSGIIHKSVKPNFQTLGKRLGKYMKDASRLIAEMSQEDISKIEAENAFVLEIDNQKFDLTAEDVVIAAEDIPGWTVATDRNLTVALDIQLTDALLAEGTARELVNRIQNLRKSADLNVTDRIHVLLTETKEITDALLQFEDYIKSETLAESIEISSDFGGERTELQEGVWTEILVKKA